MEIVTSKDICILSREILRLLDRRVIDHGSRVAFILHRMLQCEDRYEEFELAEFALLGMIHDIGAYKVEKTSEILKFDISDTMPHSIYGSLFMKYISPMSPLSKIIMYHHVDAKQLADVDYEYKNIANFLNFANFLDIYNNSMGTRFDYNRMRSYMGSRFSSRCFELFDLAEARYNVFARLKDGQWSEQLDEIYNDIIFSDEEKDKFIDMLMYISGFRVEYNVVDTVTTTCVATEIADRMGTLSKDDYSTLYYASLLHDVGMLTVPLEIIDAPRKLTDEEFVRIRKHVEVTETLLRGRIHDSVTDVAVAHHERCDGSGYPKKMKGIDMNMPMMILQVADTVTGLTSIRKFREPKKKDAVISILTDEVNHNRYNRPVVMTFINNYDSIMDIVQKRSMEVMANWKKLNSKYEQVKQSMTK